MTDDADKIKAIVNYIKNNFEWDGIKDYLAYDLNKIYEMKKGSSGDLNILLHTMLQEAGFKPTLVLLSTQSHGIIQKALPPADQFNYILSKLEVGGKSYFLDATDPYLPFDVPPLDCTIPRALKWRARLSTGLKSFPLKLIRSCKRSSHAYPRFIIKGPGNGSISRLRCD